MNEQLDRLAHAIAKAGNKLVFGVPGGGLSLALIDRLSSLDVRFITTHSEASAAVISGTIGYMSGTAGVSVSIKGPGLANALPGIAFCSFEQFPMVAISESYDACTPISLSHKRLDHKKLTSAVSKQTNYCYPNNNYEFSAGCAEAEVPGPVVLNLAEGQSNFEHSHSLAGCPEPDKSVIEKIKTSKKPIVIVGSLAARTGLGVRLSKLNVPVFTTVSAKGVVDESRPCSAGIFTGAGLELTPEDTIIPAADSIICIGLRHTEVLLAEPFRVPSINLELSEHNYSDGFGFSGVFELRIVDEIFDILEQKNWGIELLATVKDSLFDKINLQKFLPPAIFRHIQEEFGQSVRVVSDTGNFCTIGEHIWQSECPKSFICSANGRYMGMGIPMSLGAAFSDRSIPTVVALGDGGIGTHISDVKIAVEENLPILFLLLSDGGFGSVRSRALRNNLDQSSLIKKNPSWFGVLVGLGVESYIVKDQKTFRDTLSKWNWLNGPLYIETPFDPEDYQNMTNGIRS